jgi:hypothetical protein
LNVGIGFEFRRFLSGAMRDVDHTGGNRSGEQQNTNDSDNEYFR